MRRLALGTPTGLYGRRTWKHAGRYISDYLLGYGRLYASHCLHGKHAGRYASDCLLGYGCLYASHCLRESYQSYPLTAAMKKSDSHESGAVLASAAKSATYGIGLQVMFRALTFLMNAFIVRYISKDLLGVVNVRLFLLYMTIYGMTSEPFVRACLSKTQNQCWPQIINLLWCSLPLGIFWSIVCGFIWLYMLEQPDSSIVPNYHLAVICYLSAALIELLSQPLFVAGQLLLLVEFRAIAEGIALMVQCIVSICLVVLVPHGGLISFSLAQLLYSSTLTVIYYWYFRHRISNRKRDDFPFTSFRDLLPSYPTDKPFVNRELYGLVWSFGKQSFLKQLLTEGEKYVMTLFDVLSFANQGIYNVVSNLGSLVVRILFLPMEDSFYLFISQVLQRGVPLKNQPKKEVELIGKVLTAVLQIRVLFGLMIATYGFSYAALALDILYGGQFSQEPGPELLRWISLYVLLVSINGITEGFKNASMTQTQVDRYNTVMLFFSLAFLGSSLFLTKSFGAVGFVLSNCVNMLLRILHSAYYIHQYFGDTTHQPVWSHLPSKAMFVGFFVTFGITASSEVVFCCDQGWKFRFLHIVIGGFCLLLNLAVFACTDRSLIKFIRNWRKLDLDASEQEQPSKSKET